MGKGHENAGRIAFEAYKTWDGKDIPPWDDIGDEIQKAWEIAAAAVLQASSDLRIHPYWKDRQCPHSAIAPVALAARLESLECVGPGPYRGEGDGWRCVGCQAVALDPKKLRRGSE